MGSRTPTSGEVRITVARLLEVAYQQNRGLTTALVREAGPLSLSVNEKGEATLTGNAGRVSFSGKDTLREIGVNAGVFRAMLAVDEEGGLRFNASIRVGFASVAASGSIDVEKLITACSGVLCKAARALQGRPSHVDRQLQEALGN